MINRFESDSEIISNNPINIELEPFRRCFRSRCNDLGISESQDASSQVVRWIGDGSAETQNEINELFIALLALPAARILPSHNDGGFLSGDLGFVYSKISSNAVDVKSTMPLLAQIIKPAPDGAIWNAVFALVAKQTAPSSSFRDVEPDTPCKSTACSQQGSEQTHAEIDERILQEIELCTYEKTMGFYEKYFENKSWSSIVARFAQEVKPQILNGRWTDYPYPATQTAFLEWFWRFQSRFPLEKHSTYYTSFSKSLDGSDCNRQPDLFLASSDTVKCDGRYNWRDVRVIGELKESVSKNNPQEVAKFCGNAREMFKNQPTCLFLHGFVLRGSIMELWVFDRSGPYSCERFDAHEDPDRFIKVIVGYTMMSDAELGLNTFIEKDEIGRWIMFKGEGNTKEEKLYLEDQAIALQRAIVCRGTTCYGAKRQKANCWEFVVEFSWRSDKRQAEGELLQLAKERQAWGVAELFGHRDLSSVADLRQGLKFGKPRSFKPRPSGSLNQTQSNSKSGSLSLGGSTTTLPSSSLSGQKRKRDRESTVTSQSKCFRYSGSRGQTYMASQAAREQPNAKCVVEKTKLSSLMPPPNNESYDNRIFCCLVISPPGRAIDRFKSIGEFLEACRDAIKVHRSLYQDGKILHRDISKNNIIIADAKNDGDPKGMLIDPDLAKELNSGLSGARHRTGTMEFMVIQVLEGHTHTYRHDLESFFYVFLWIIIRHNAEGGEKNLSKESELRKWYAGSYRTIALAKTAHMLEHEFRYILDEFPCQFDGLKELAEELRMALFPALPETVFRGTFRDHNKLYTPMLNAFNKALVKLSGKTG